MRFLHLQCLQDAPDKAVEIAAISGAMGIDPASLKVVRPFEEFTSVSSLDGVSGLTIGGSALSVFYAIPRYAALERIIQEARNRGVPMFGICFGAQVIADAYGGKVIRDPAKAEYGTIEVVCETLLGYDELFGGAPMRFTAQSWHRDRIIRLPPYSRALARSQDGTIQAFRINGAPVWGVQFHPERDMETFQHLLETRSDPPGRSVADIRSGLRPSPHAAALLSRFARFCEACASRP